MVELSQKHGMEMAKKGDEAHIKVIEKMREGMKNPEAMREWVEKVRKEFEALPENE